MLLCKCTKNLAKFTTPLQNLRLQSKSYFCSGRTGRFLNPSYFYSNQSQSSTPPSLNPKPRDIINRKSKERKTYTEKSLEDWVTVYRFNHVLGARALQKFKVYQTAFSCFFIAPTSVGLYFHGILDENTTFGILCATIFTCGVLYYIGNIFNRIVAIVYTSPSKREEVRIARLTFWGNRLDELFDAKDFVPLGDLDSKPTDLYFRLKQYSDYDNFMYLTPSAGTIYNVEEFERIFGAIPEGARFKIGIFKDDKDKHDNHDKHDKGSAK